MKSYDSHKSKVEVRQSDTRQMNLRALIWSVVVSAALLLGLVAVYNFIS